MSHRQFFIKISQNHDYIQNFAMIAEIHFILHAANGLYIIIHIVIWYNYTNTNTNISIFILTLV